MKIIYMVHNCLRKLFCLRRNYGRAKFSIVETFYSDNVVPHTCSPLYFIEMNIICKESCLIEKTQILENANVFDSFSTSIC